MTKDPSTFIQAHRLVKDAMRQPFRQWRLSLVAIAISSISVVVLMGVLSLPLLLNADPYSDAGGLYEGAAVFEDPLVFMALTSLLALVFFVWASAIWWRSQGGRIKLATPLKTLWWIGVILLLPALVQVAGTAPWLSVLIWPDPDRVDPPPDPLLLRLLVNFAYYWLTLRLALALVQTARGRPMGVAQGWAATKPHNKLCLFAAWDLSLFVLFVDAIMRAVQSVSDARWDRAVEAYDDATYAQLALFDTLAVAAETVVLAWLVLVELALVWSLAQKCLKDAS